MKEDKSKDSLSKDTLWSVCSDVTESVVIKNGSVHCGSSRLTSSLFTNSNPETTDVKTPQNKPQTSTCTFTMEMTYQSMKIAHQAREAVSG